MAKENVNKVEVVILKSFSVGRKRYPLWTHQQMSVETAKKAVEEGKAKYAEQ